MKDSPTYKLTEAQRAAIGSRIWIQRDKAGITQIELELQVGCTSGIAWQWEKGNRMPSAGMLIRLSQIFGVSIDYLLLNKQEESNQ